MVFNKEKLEQLIQEGEEVRVECVREGTIGNFVTGEKYETWIAKSIMFIEKNRVSETLVERFKNAAKNAVGNSESHLDTMMGILKALKEYD